MKTPSRTAFCLSLGLTLLFLCSAQQAEAQLAALRQYDYHRADSVALHSPKEKNETYPQLAHRLADGFSTEQEKYRVIFRWITENIRYSYAGKKQDGGKAFEKGYAVCAGYADLLKEMCQYVGLDCITITGYAKNAYDDLGLKLRKLESHAWNAVKLGGEWYLCDATWAAGTYDKKTQKFTKRYNDYYFLGNPEWFSYSHYPTDPKQQLRDKPVSRRQFERNPIVLDSAEYFGFHPTNPSKGVLHRWHSGRIRFTFSDSLTAKRFHLASTSDDQYPAYQEQKGSVLLLAAFKKGKHVVLELEQHAPVAIYQIRLGHAPQRRYERYLKRVKKAEAKS